MHGQTLAEREGGLWGVSLVQVEGAIRVKMRALAKQLRDERVDLCTMSSVRSYVSLIECVDVCLSLHA